MSIPTAQPRSITPFFGRAYSLTITPSQGPSAGVPIVISSDAFEPEALRFTFDIYQYAWETFWQAEITLYNANGPITSGPSSGVNLYQAIIQEGDIVTVSAGYQADYPSGYVPAIWTGPVFYTIQDKQDVVDQRLTLHCLLNRVLTVQNFINDTLPALSTQFTQAQFIASQSLNTIKFNQDSFNAVLATSQAPRGPGQLPRAKTYFGVPHNYLNNLARQNNLNSWFDQHSWNFDNLQQPLATTLAATYAPVNPQGGPPARVGGVTLSLIGQPQQTQLGVDFRVLLDPTIQVVAPLPVVAVLPQYIRQAPITYPIPAGQIPVQPLAAQYAVVGVRFLGDTRGNDWYSDITGRVPGPTLLAAIGGN
jgi:hypothetical protein